MRNQWDDLLPTHVNVCGYGYGIRSDYRAVLDICTALQDPELTSEEKGIIALEIFYPDFDDMPTWNYREALEKCYWFINCGRMETDNKKAPRLVDWEQDFQYIVAPINRVMGKEIRSLDYLHWWTFISAFNEIGDCTFAQIVRIRKLKSKGKKLDKSDQAWYKENRDIVEIKRYYTDAENELVEKWTGHGV